MARLIQLQGQERHAMHDRVARQSLFSEVVPARPGEIVDRCGRVLAMTESCDSLFAVPDQIQDPWRFAWQLSQVLNLNADMLHRRLVEHSDRQFLWIKRRLTKDESQAVRLLALPRSEWGMRREYQRRYPHGGFAAHVLGLRDIDNFGRGGLEQSRDQSLRGIDGRRVMTRDALGIIMEVAEERSRPPRHGQAVVTTLDLPIQMAAEEALDDVMARWQPVGACAIVMEPQSGDILAMVSRPAFDPTSLERVPEAAWKNLAVSAVFEPGSTFKPFVVAAALQSDVLQQDEFIDCSFGAYRMGPRVLHDVHPYGALSVEDVLVKSSNIGMARIAERMGLPALYEATRTFGFGRRTGVELPGEVSGILRPLADWDGYSLGSIPMGQELAVTPLQLITAHAALANGGRLVRPHLIHDTSQLAVSPQVASRTVTPARDIGARIVDESIARWVVSQPMHEVVERGTARSVRVPGLSMFGKTGTAQKADPQRGGYSDTATVLSFVCGAPANDPEILVLVMVDEPTRPGSHFGGTVAGPVAVRILQETLPRVRELGFRRVDPKLSRRDP
jgi:cell division protein FtsI/penicillin-binding protein 2